MSTMSTLNSTELLATENIGAHLALAIFGNFIDETSAFVNEDYKNLVALYYYHWKEKDPKKLVIDELLFDFV